MKKILILTVVMTAFVASSCGGGGMYTSSGMQEEFPDTGESPKISCSAETPCPVSITKNAFLFASDFPADIVIPEVDGAKDTVFVVTSSYPAGVLAIDLTTNPLTISSKYEGVVSPAGTGYPATLFILNASRGFMLTSSHVIDFNPTTGTVHKSLAINYSITLPSPLPSSNGSENISKIVPSYPNSVAAVKNQLYVTTSNYINPLSPATAAPGTVLVFDILDKEPFLKAKAYIVTTDYNPTGITPLGNDRIAVTNSGISDLVGAHAEPKTMSSIDVIDTTLNKISANIPVGIAGLSFQEIALTSDSRVGFIGSISYGEIYELDFTDNKAIYDKTNPITLTGNGVGSDYLSAQVITSDGKYLFVSSFENSAVYPVDISADPPKPLPKHFSPEPFIVGFPSGVTSENPTGTNTGAGPLAIRDGYPDIFVLTGYPGTMVAIGTNYKGTPLEENTTPPIIDAPINPPTEENPPDVKPSGDSSDNPYLPHRLDPNEACSGFAVAVTSVNISADGGYKNTELPSIVLGAPEPPNTVGGKKGTDPAKNGVVSLGSGGDIVLDMGECEIVNGIGDDLTVFENAFFVTSPTTPSDSFPEIAVKRPQKVNVWSEPARVGVSEDGSHFKFFPCDFNKASTGSFYDRLQSGCAGITPTLYGRDPLVAGLEKGAGGDSFDLANIGIKKARYVKIVSKGTFIPLQDGELLENGVAGFDLDAVAVVNGKKAAY